MYRLQQPLPDAYTLATPEELEARIAAAKAELSDRLLILGHHYQRDEVIRWADSRGDSLKLARYAAENRWASDIVFCGVHFMAESADVLTGPDQRVVLPQNHLVVELPIDPAFDDALDVAEVGDHVALVETVGPHFDFDDRVVSVRMLADAVVVEQPVPVTEVDAFGDEIHANW